MHARELTSRLGRRASSAAIRRASSAVIGRASSAVIRRASSAVIRRVLNVNRVLSETDVPILLLYIINASTFTRR
jgi:hypothetical protein